MHRIIDIPYRFRGLSNTAIDSAFGLRSTKKENIINIIAPGKKQVFHNNDVFGDSWYSRTYAWSSPRLKNITEKLIVIFSKEILPISSGEKNQVVSGSVKNPIAATPIGPMANCKILLIFILIQLTIIKLYVFCNLLNIIFW